MGADLWRKILCFLLFISLTEANNVHGGRSHRPQAMSKTAGKANDELRLAHRLKKLYSPSVRPVLDYNDTVIVDIALSLRAIHNVDEDLGSADLEVWLIQKWTDHFVAWDSTAFSGIEKTFVEAHLLWHPKLVVAHSGHTDQPVTKSVEARVAHDGVVMLQLPLKVKATCDVNLSQFPFESLHACTVVLHSMRYSTDEVTLRFANNIRTMDMAHFRAARRWHANTVPGSVSTAKDEWSQSEHQQVTFRLQLQRKGRAQEMGIYVAPMVLLALLVPALFILPNSSKIVLGMGLLVSWSVLLNQLTQVLPSPSGRIPILEQYYLGVFVLLCLAILLSSVTINMAHEIHTRPPYLLTRVMKSVFRCVRWVTCLRRFTPDDATSPVSTQYDTTDLSSTNGRPLGDSSSYSSLNMLQKLDGDGDGLQGVTPVRPSPQVQWAFIASTLDRVGFVLFLGAVFLLPLALVVAVCGS